MKFGAQLSLFMKRELKLSDSSLLTLLTKVAERKKAKIILPILSDNFWLRTSVEQKVFLFTFVTTDKSKSLRGSSGEV